MTKARLCKMIKGECALFYLTDMYFKGGLYLAILFSRSVQTYKDPNIQKAVLLQKRIAQVSL